MTRVATDLVVYGDFNCPYSCLASSRADALVARGDARIEWRAVEHDPAIPSPSEPVEGELAAMLDREVGEIRGLLGDRERFPIVRPPVHPNSATATRNLAMHQAGAGAGGYNATRQVASVLGSAAVAVLMDSRLAAQGLQFDPARAGEASGGGTLPPQALDKFSTAMAQASWLVPAAFVVGFVAVMFFERPGHQSAPARATEASVAQPAP